MRSVDDAYRYVRQVFEPLYRIGEQGERSICPVLAGGAVRDTFRFYRPNDWDLYVKTDEEANQLIEALNMYVNWDSGSGPEEWDWCNYMQVPFNRLVKGEWNGFFIDIIVIKYHTIRQIIYNFDYTVNAAAFRIGCNEFTCHPYFFPDNSNGILRQVHDDRDIPATREQHMIGKGYRRMECESQTSETGQETSTNSPPPSLAQDWAPQYCRFEPIPDTTSASSTPWSGVYGQADASASQQQQSQAQVWRPSSTTTDTSRSTGSGQSTIGRRFETYIMDELLESSPSETSSEPQTSTS